jgi:hypothetical protein
MGVVRNSVVSHPPPAVATGKLRCLRPTSVERSHDQATLATRLERLQLRNRHADDDLTTNKAGTAPLNKLAVQLVAAAESSGKE